MVAQPGRIIFLKSLKVDDSGSVEYYVRGKRCSPNYLMHSFTDTNELNDIIKAFEASLVCPACPEAAYGNKINVVPTAGIKKTITWRSDHCELIHLPGLQRCQYCSALMRARKKQVDRGTCGILEKLSKSLAESKSEKKKNRKLNSKLMVNEFFFL